MTLTRGFAQGLSTSTLGQPAAKPARSSVAMTDANFLATSTSVLLINTALDARESQALKSENTSLTGVKKQERENEKEGERESERGGERARARGPCI